MFTKFFQGALGVFSAYILLWILMPALIVIMFLFFGYILLG